MKGKPMKTNQKRLITGMFLLLILSQFTIAQPDRREPVDPEKMVANRLEKMDEALNLTDNQKNEIKIILADEQAAMAEYRPSSGQRPSREEMESMRSTMEKLRSETNEKILPLLTDDQKEAFTKSLKTERQNRPKRRR